MGVQNAQLMDLKVQITNLINVLNAKKGILWIIQAYQVMMQFVLVLLKTDNILAMLNMFGVLRLMQIENVSQRLEIAKQDTSHIKIQLIALKIV